MMTLERMYGRTGSDSLASETQGDLSLHDERCSTTPQIASRPASLIPGIRLPQRETSSSDSCVHARLSLHSFLCRTRGNAVVGVSSRAA